MSDNHAGTIAASHDSTATVSTAPTAATPTNSTAPGSMSAPQLPSTSQSIPPSSQTDAPTSSAAQDGASTKPTLPPMQHQTNPAPPSQQAGHASFRRQRASRACEVRCDAASLGVPCTNCVAFSIECKIPTPKRKKTGAAKAKDSDSDRGDAMSQADKQSPAAPLPQPTPRSHTHSATPVALPQLPPRDGIDYTGMPATSNTEDYIASAKVQDQSWAQYMKPKFARAPIKEAGRVAYLGESSNLSLLVHDRHGNTDVVHYPLPETMKGTKARVTELDDLELRVLHERGAFLLPPRQLCDELVDAFFTWIAPVVPVINRSKFMRRYKDPKNPPSLLLLQAILLAGSRVCTNSQLMDVNGSTTPAAMTFYKRAKALFDANYEDDRVTIVQSLILMGWYWEGPEDVTKNVFYWSRVAIIVAQGSGMHRSVERSQLSKPDKRLWKRIWWTLFTRDRSVAVALGRPCGISIEDADVEMVSEEDFIEDEPDKPAEYPPDPVHVQFFLNYVKLCEIMGLVLSQNYSASSQKRGHNNAIDLTHCDMALADWLQNCPKEVYWDKNNHQFWPALLHSNYYTTLCLLHRAHMPPAGADGKVLNGYPDDMAYPSRNIAYQAAGMITAIVESLEQHNETRYTPAFIVYSLFSALIMHVYQMRSSNQAVVSTTQQRLTICMNALKSVSKVWLVAKMVHTLFESILGNKQLEERLQKAAGKAHSKHKPKSAPVGLSRSDSETKPTQAQKRKFEDLDFGTYSGGPPSAQMSYERSRPQSPVNAPKDNQQSHGHLPPTLAGSPPLRQNSDAFMGASRSGTRQTTPFNTYSYPGTPPDLFLHTRNSPNISQDLWQNYQPDQLFPPDMNMLFPLSSPGQSHHGMVDPALRHAPGPQQPQTTQYTPVSLHQAAMPPQQTHPTPPPPQHMANTMHHEAAMHPPGSNGLAPHSHPSQLGQPQYQDPAAWAQFQQAEAHRRPDDTWSQHSGSAQSGGVPTTLNVDDWFQFFGIPNSDMAAMHGQF
ncbi:hypothetical protein AAFC00_002010 [Neodothiora populina]|uniref:Xylanolytic transcriptional activator regulatory domain-containing protein n=2 Tax=Neodothiora populina TaxID=2781224 RepID=A0ABR3PH60_9PEZI